MPVKSKAQAGFMGAIVGGQLRKKGLSKEKAKEFLRGVNIKKLPKKKKQKHTMTPYEMNQMMLREKMMGKK